MKEYFVKIYDGQEVKVKEILHFYGEEKLLNYLQDNKDKQIAIYEGKCFLDWT